MPRKKAIIVGGGVAGLATAGGLLRLGWAVTVYEQAEAFGPVGAGILIAPNGMRALDWLGLGERLRSKSLAHGEVALRHARGGWLLRSKTEDFEARFGVPSFALHRADLHDMLLESARGATLCPGCQIIGAHGGAAPAVRYERDGEVGEDSADLVIGADGIDSCVRNSLFSERSWRAYAGYITWRSVVAADEAQTESIGVTETWNGGQRFGLCPLADGRVYWFATASGREGAHLNDGIEQVRERFRGWHDPIPALLAKTANEALLAHDIYYVDPPLPRYNTGRVVLIGDAAHAVTPDIGQGGCQALEDAVTLVDLLATTSGTARALAAFDSERRKRTQRISRTSTLWGRVGQWRNPLAVATRNTLVRLIPPSLFLKMSEHTLGWRPPASALTSQSDQTGREKTWAQ